VGIDERELTGNRLADALIGLAADATTRTAMAKAIRAFARPDAAARIADRAFELATASRER
jgi:UDP-N-acetylglucosamine:LPS N-acetylglucosamine transferase